VEAVESEVLRLASLAVRFEVWDIEVLSAKLKAKPAVVDDFFGRAWVEVFCGAEAARARWPSVSR